MEKTQKRGRLPIAVACAIVCLVIASSLVGQTSSRYSTGASDAAEARVAVWGFDKVGEATTSLFSATYGDLVASRDGNTAVIAPGTSGSAELSFEYDGGQGTAPEVAYDVTVSPTITDGTGASSSALAAKLDENGDFVWHLTYAPSSEAKVQTFTYTKCADFLAALKGLSGDTGGTKHYGAGMLPTALCGSDGTGRVVVGWEWTGTTRAADGVDTTNAETLAASDVADTEMGNATNLGSIKLHVNVSAVQSLSTTSETA